MARYYVSLLCLWFVADLISSLPPPPRSLDDYPTGGTGIILQGEDQTCVYKYFTEKASAKRKIEMDVGHDLLYNFSKREKLRAADGSLITYASLEDYTTNAADRDRKWLSEELWGRGLAPARQMATQTQLASVATKLETAIQKLRPRKQNVDRCEALVIPTRSPSCDLFSYIDYDVKKGHYPKAHYLSTLSQLYDSLILLKALGYHHGDIKPENILMVPHHGPVLIDFYSASKTDKPWPVDAGTDGYRSPECNDHMPAREGADVYTMGMVMYDLIGHLSDDVWKLAGNKYPRFSPEHVQFASWLHAAILYNTHTPHEHLDLKTGKVIGPTTQPLTTTPEAGQSPVDEPTDKDIRQWLFVLARLDTIPQENLRITLAQSHDIVNHIKSYNLQEPLKLVKGYVNRHIWPAVQALEGKIKWDALTTGVVRPTKLGTVELKAALDLESQFVAPIWKDEYNELLSTKGSHHNLRRSIVMFYMGYGDLADMLEEAQTRMAWDIRSVRKTGINRLDALVDKFFL